MFVVARVKHATLKHVSTRQRLMERFVGRRWRAFLYLVGDGAMPSECLLNWPRHQGDGIDLLFVEWEFANEMPSDVSRSLFNVWQRHGFAFGLLAFCITSYHRWHNCLIENLLRSCLVASHVFLVMPEFSHSRLMLGSCVAVPWALCMSGRGYVGGLWEWRCTYVVEYGWELLHVHVSFSVATRLPGP